MTVDELTEAILIAHQRRDIRGCLCGWTELGKSHPGHQTAMLREAGLLAVEPDSDRAKAMLREAGLLA